MVPIYFIIFRLPHETLSAFTFLGVQLKQVIVTKQPLCFLFVTRDDVWEHVIQPEVCHKSKWLMKCNSQDGKRLDFSWSRHFYQSPHASSCLIFHPGSFYVSITKTASFPNTLTREPESRFTSALMTSWMDFDARWNGLRGHKEASLPTYFVFGNSITLPLFTYLFKCLPNPPSVYSSLSLPLSPSLQWDWRTCWCLLWWRNRSRASHPLPLPSSHPTNWLYVLSLPTLRATDWLYVEQQC